MLGYTFLATYDITKLTLINSREPLTWYGNKIADSNSDQLAIVAVPTNQTSLLHNRYVDMELIEYRCNSCPPPMARHDRLQYKYIKHDFLQWIDQDSFSFFTISLPNFLTTIKPSYIHTVYARFTRLKSRCLVFRGNFIIEEVNWDQFFELFYLSSVQCA